MADDQVQYPRPVPVEDDEVVPAPVVGDQQPPPAAPDNGVDQPAQNELEV